MGSTLYSKRLKKGKQRKPRDRPKKYKTKEAAESAAERKGLKNYTVVPQNKKFIINVSSKEE